MTIKLKIGFKQRMVNTIDGLATITKKMYIIYRKFWFFSACYTYRKSSWIRKKLCHY